MIVADFEPTVEGSKRARSLQVSPANSVVVSVQSVGWPVSRSNCAAPAPPNGNAGERHRLRAGVRDRRLLCGGRPVVDVLRAERQGGRGAAELGLDAGAARATVTSGAFEVTVIVADFDPTVEGSERARSLHVSPIASVVVSVQSLGWPVSRSKCAASAPPSETPVKVTEALPEFVTVDSCAAVGPSSMSREPNVRLVGLRLSAVWSSNAPTSAPRRPRARSPTRADRR